MFISHNREKLLNAILYFVENTNYCNTLKLFKLLNFLDFEHYRQTGVSVTGLKYEAWKQGPVSRELWNEVCNPKQDFSAVVSVSVVRDELTDVPSRRDFIPRKRFDQKYFTKRELQTMDRLAFFFRDLTANQISQYSHTKGMPWSKIYTKNKQATAVIPYELALESNKIVEDMPTIDKEELDYLKEAFAEIDNMK
mgnify:FL=1